MRNQCSYIANDSLKIKIRSLSYFVSLILNFIFHFMKIKRSKKESKIANIEIFIFNLIRHDMKVTEINL